MQNGATTDPLAPPASGFFDFRGGRRDNLSPGEPGYCSAVASREGFLLAEPGGCSLQLPALSWNLPQKKAAELRVLE